MTSNHVSAQCGQESAVGLKGVAGHISDGRSPGHPSKASREHLFLSGNFDSQEKIDIQLPQGKRDIQSSLPHRIFVPFYVSSN